MTDYKFEAGKTYPLRGVSKIEVGKTYQTRDGKTVRILATDLKFTKPVVGAILFEDEVEIVSTFDADGSYYSSDTKGKFDIIIPPERKSRWLNWYGPNGGGTACDREQADECAVAAAASNFRTHVLEIITEDGKPVEVKIHEVTQKRATQGEG